MSSYEVIEALIEKANEKNKNWANLKKALPDMHFMPIHHIRDLGKMFSKK